MKGLKSSLFLFFAHAEAVQAQIAAYGQCGGTNWCFNVDCQPGYYCIANSASYHQCVPSAVPPGYLGPYVQCGGSITTPCTPGYTCSTSNGYLMCTPIIYTTMTTINTCLAHATSSSTAKLVSSSSTSSLKTTLTSSTKSSNIVSSSPIKQSSSRAVTTSASSKAVSSSPTALLSSTSTIASPPSLQTPYGQCGGIGWSGPTACTSDWTCIPQPDNPYYSQCLPGTNPGPAQQSPYGQCGGIGWTGPTTCTSGWTCIPQPNNPYYSQCLLSTNSPPGDGHTLTSSTTLATKVSASSKTSSQTKSTAPASSSQTKSRSSATSTKAAYGGLCTPSPVSCGVPNYPPPCAGSVKFAGINIAGCDFGTDTNGDQSPSAAYCPIGQYNPDGPGQMTHFASEKFNIFRLPTGWQYIVNSNNPASNLDPANWGNYMKLVQACLNTGAYCLIDIHNYARFNGAVIGQGGPSNALFAQLWANIAAVYAFNPRIMFGIMNEPHDSKIYATILRPPTNRQQVNIATWAQTVQVVVTAIRNAGASSQVILLPGNDYTGVGTFVSDGSGPALAAVVNPDGTTDNLIFDVHKYLDQDGSGTNTICVGDQISNAFAPLAQWLRCNGRQALLSETGGSGDSSCLKYMCSAISFLNANSDVYLGYIGWAAGSFSTGYTLAETPSNNNGIWSDMAIVSQCLVPH